MATYYIFLRRSFALLCLFGTVLGFMWWISRSFEEQRLQAEQTAKTLATQRLQAEVMQREIDRVGADTLDQVVQSVPTTESLPRFFEWLEQRAAARGVELRYNFGATSAADQQPRGQWLVAVDFLGSADALSQLLAELESGLYTISIETMRFDVSNPARSQLGVEMLLYGR